MKTATADETNAYVAGIERGISIGRERAAKIARDFAEGFKAGTVEGDISYAAVIAVAKLIEGGGK